MEVDFISEEEEEEEEEEAEVHHIPAAIFLYRHRYRTLIRSDRIILSPVSVDVASKALWLCDYHLPMAVPSLHSA